MIKRIGFEVVFTKTPDQVITVETGYNRDEFIAWSINNRRYMSQVSDEGDIVIQRMEDILEEDERICGWYEVEPCEHEFEIGVTIGGLGISFKADVCKHCGERENVVFETWSHMHKSQLIKSESQQEREVHCSGRVTLSSILPPLSGKF